MNPYTNRPFGHLRTSKADYETSPDTRCGSGPRRLYILCWSGRPAILPLQLWQGCQVCVKLSAHATTSKSSPILRLLSSHWATSVFRTRVVGVANGGDSLRRLSSLQNRIYNLLGREQQLDKAAAAVGCGAGAGRSQ